MVIKRNLGDYIFDTFNYIFLIFLMFATIYPFLHVLMGSISDSKAMTGYYGFMFYPRGSVSLDAYSKAFANPMLIRSYLNTIFYCISFTSISIFLTSMGGYVLSRKNLKWKNVMTVFIIIPMYFGGGLIPFYLLVSRMHMIDTVWSIILPGAVGTYNLILMRTNFKEVPAEMEESAKMDGAGHMTILYRIIIPLALPIMAVITLFSIVGMWNTWFTPSIFLISREKYPLQLVLREILILNNTYEMMKGVPNLAGAERNSVANTIKYALIVISILPILCAYPFLQKYFVKGIMIGALKG